jgi:drug/metabolite transporter (DMT)-like permease
MIYLLKHVKSQLVTLSIPTQFLLGSIAAIFLFGEIPSAWFYPGAALVLAGVVLGVLRSDSTTRAKR